jgi:hypothetical protein
LEQRLTTLDFNSKAFVHQILAFILRPPRRKGLYRHVACEVEGMIIERNTTGKAKTILVKD